MSNISQKSDGSEATASYTLFKLCPRKLLVNIKKIIKISYENHNSEPTARSILFYLYTIKLLLK